MNTRIRVRGGHPEHEVEYILDKKTSLIEHITQAATDAHALADAHDDNNDFETSDKYKLAEATLLTLQHILDVRLPAGRIVDLMHRGYEDSRRKNPPF